MCFDVEQGLFMCMPACGLSLCIRLQNMYVLVYMHVCVAGCVWNVDVCVCVCPFLLCIWMHEQIHECGLVVGCSIILLRLVIQVMCCLGQQWP